MQYVIENEDGEFYAGFQEGKPVWFRSRSPKTRFDEPLADTILRQMTSLGFQKLTKKLYEGKKEKAKA